MIGLTFFKGGKTFSEYGLRSQESQPNYIDEMYIKEKNKILGTILRLYFFLMNNFPYI